jgi:hypothetical protein
MAWPLTRDAAMGALLRRAFALWVLVRLVFGALSVAAQAAGSSVSPNVAGLVLACGLVGMIDIRRRGERVFWANLGVSPQFLFAVYCAAALPGEIALKLVRF